MHFNITISLLQFQLEYHINYIQSNRFCQENSTHSKLYNLNNFIHGKSERTKRSLFLIECGNDLSSRQVTLQVLSARQSLTSVFGMRTGGPLRYHHHNGYIICILYTGYIRLFSVEH